MSPLAEVIPGAVLLVMALGLIGAAGGLVVELVWDEWQAGQRWRDVDRLARLEFQGRRPLAARPGMRAPGMRAPRRGRRWEATFVEPVASRVRPRS